MMLQEGPNPVEYERRETGRELLGAPLDQRLR